MLNGYDIIDADGHVQEPVTLWADRLPKELLERAPRFHGTSDSSRGNHAKPVEMAKRRPFRPSTTRFIPQVLT